MTGYFSISVKCPLCGKSLMDKDYPLRDKPSIKLNIQGEGKRGVVHLCSLYGCFDHETNIDITDIDIAEFSCPHCNQLLNTTETCETCQAPMISFHMEGGGRVSICSRKGCQKHYVAFEDVQDEMRRFYEEYG